MKKLGLFLLTSVLVAYFVGVSCTLVNNKDSDSESDIKPGVTKQENGYSISFKKIEGMKYATIIRNSSISKSMDLYKTVKVGQIIIDDVSKIHQDTFVYQDNDTAAGRYYSYKVQIVTNNGTSTTSFSDPVKGLGSGEAELEANVDTSNNEKVFLTYLFDARSMERKIILPDTYFVSVPSSYADKDNPQIRFSILDSAKPESQNLFILKQAKVIDSGAICDLKAEFTKDYFAKNLELSGLVGLYKDTDKENGYSTYHITNPLETGLYILEYDEKGETTPKHDGITEIKPPVFNVPEPSSGEIIDLNGNKR